MQIISLKTQESLKVEKKVKSVKLRQSQMPGLVVHTFNLSTHKAEAGGLL